MSPLLRQDVPTTPLLSRVGELGRELQHLAAQLTLLSGAEGLIRQATNVEHGVLRLTASAVRTAGVDVELVAAELHRRALEAGDCGHGYRVTDSCPGCDLESEGLLAAAEPAQLPTIALQARPSYRLPAADDVDELFEARIAPSEARAPGERYWVARAGLVVTHQVEGDLVQRTEHATVDEARGEFAEQTCDPGAGAPQAGDTIRVYYGAAEERTFDVERVEVLNDMEWAVTAAGAAEEDDPVFLAFGQFRITARRHATDPVHLSTEPLPAPAPAGPAQGADAGGCPGCGTRGEWQPGPARALICGACGHRA